MKGDEKEPQSEEEEEEEDKDSSSDEELIGSDEEEEEEEEEIDGGDDNEMMEGGDESEELVGDDAPSESDEEEDHYRKFHEKYDISKLEKLHPDTMVCNNEEVMALSRVIRNSKGQICDPMHTTLPFITKYETARVIGARAEQIDRGAAIFITVEPEIINGRVIAQMEFAQKKIPFILARPLPNGRIEYWRLDDLEVL